MMENKEQQYEMGKQMLETLIKEHGLVKGFKLYYKAVLTGEFPTDDISN